MKTSHRLPGRQLLHPGRLLLLPLMVLMSLLILAPSAGAVEVSMTLEQCKAMDHNQNGQIGDDEEDYYYWDLPDYNGNGAGADQEDQDIAQAYCNDLLTRDANSTDELVAEIVRILIAILEEILA